jgi:hypothetical protein
MKTRIREVDWACDCGAGEGLVHLQGCAQSLAAARRAMPVLVAEIEADRPEAAEAGVALRGRGAT